MLDCSTNRLYLDSKDPYPHCHWLRFSYRNSEKRWSAFRLCPSPIRSRLQLSRHRWLHYHNPSKDFVVNTGFPLHDSKCTVQNVSRYIMLIRSFARLSTTPYVTSHKAIELSRSQCETRLFCMSHLVWTVKTPLHLPRLLNPTAAVIQYSWKG